MMIDLLVDTNILIYALNRDSVYHRSARSMLQNPKHNLFITTKNISEFFAVCSKFKISLNSSLNYYQELKANATILFPSEKSLLTFEKLIQQYKPKGNRIFDVEIVSIMLANGIDTIATFNLKDFVNINEVHLFELT